MVYNKVIAPNKVIFSYFKFFFYENQVILENSLILNDMLKNVRYHTKYRNSQGLFDFHKKVKITKYDFVRSYDFVIYHDGKSDVTIKKPLNDNSFKH